MRLPKPGVEGTKLHIVVIFHREYLMAIRGGVEVDYRNQNATTLTRHAQKCCSSFNATLNCKQFEMNFVILCSNVANSKEKKYEKLKNVPNFLVFE